MTDATFQFSPHTPAAWVVRLGAMLSLAGILLLFLPPVTMAQDIVPNNGQVTSQSTGQDIGPDDSLQSPPSTDATGDATGQPEAEAAVAYSPTLIGAPDPEIADLLREVSTTFRSADRPPPSLYLLRKRVDDDAPRMLDVLKSKGYYSAKVRVDIDEKASPVTVAFTVEAGPVYKLAKVEVGTSEPLPADVRLPSLADMGLQTGQPALAETILDAEDRLLAAFKTKGFPFPSLSKRRVVVDLAAQDVSVDFVVDPGPAATFGPTTVSGQEKVREDYIRHKIPWKQGQRYDAKLVDSFQNILVKTGLFSLVRIEPARAVESDGSLPVVVNLVERKHRTVRAGAFYSSDVGPGIRASWENRNLLGRGEDLELSTVIAQRTQNVLARFQKPEFLREDQTFVGSFRIANDDTDAYTSQNVIMSAIVDRAITPKVTIGGGVGLDAAYLRQAVGGETVYVLLSLPMHADWNNKNDLLNPTRGETATLQLQPYWDMLAQEFSFFKILLGASHYLPLLDDPSVIFATRANVGSLLGSSTLFIPADKRFYAGGGGSVRGYSYQKAGPLDAFNDPIGGRSIFEVSGELRYRMTEKFGLVAFLDGGNVYSFEYPQISEGLLWGTGLGVRYFTPIGPLRFDVATPLDRRQGIDSAFQFYVSLGQAF